MIPTDYVTARGRNTEPVRLRGWESVLAAGVLGLFLVLRWPLITDAGVTRGWTSDAGVIGLMGKRIYQHREVPVFFWGQNYLGPMTSLLEAVLGALLLATPLAPGVWTLALRLATMAEVFLGAVFFWLGLRRGFSRAAAALAFLWLAAGPGYLFESSVVPRDEIAFFCAGILFWVASNSFDPHATRRPLDSIAGCLWLGLVTGFCWWMNAGVVFVLAAAGILIVQRTETYASLRKGLRLQERLLLRPGPLGWNVPTAGMAAARLWNAALLLWVIFGVLDELGLVSTSFFLFDPLRDPLALWLASQIVFEILWGDRESHRRMASTARRELSVASRRLAAFAVGALVGFSPVILGRLFHWYTVSYGRQAFSLGLAGIVPHLQRMISNDLWRWIGAGPSLLFHIVLTVSVVVLAWKRRRDLSPFFSLREQPATPVRLAGTLVAVCLLFYALALRRGGPPRYIVEGAPAALAFLSASLISLVPERAGRVARSGARLAAFAVAVVLLAVQVRQAWAFRRTILDQPDPRAITSSIRAAGYSICYASVWDTYRLQFASDELVRFIPYSARSRNRDESESLAMQPSRKCFLLPDGGFREFLPTDRPVPPLERRRRGNR